MSSVDLQDSIVEGAIRSTNFFNGRLLTARDLSNEQSASREADRRLGQMVGDGIAYGLEISEGANSKKEAPVVTVEPGLAINRSGQTLRLLNKTDVALVRRASTTSVAPQIFTECLPLQSGAYVAGAGLYLLTLAPAQTSEGRAAINSLDNATVSCNTDLNVSAVQLRLLSLDQALSQEAAPDQDRLRNHIAYRCYGIAGPNAVTATPFATTTERYGLLDELRDNPLTDCDVPLGVLFWTLSDGIRFIDMWSVRRRLITRSAYQSWGVLAGDRRLGEAEASFLQFQDQLQSMISTEGAALADLRADQRFEFLPAAGFLPVGGQLDWQTFLGPLATLRPIATDEGLLRSILQQSFFRDPIRVGSFAEALKPRVNPPVPVDCYFVPEHDDFVMFTHSLRTRIRVFLTPPPTSADGLIIEALSSSTSLSVEAMSPNEGGRFEIVATEPDIYTINVNAPGFFKSDLLAVQGISGRTSDVEIALAVLPRGSLVVSVTRKDTSASINDKVSSVTATAANDVAVAGARDANGNWLISDLESGSYDITVFAAGFDTGGIQGVTVSAGQKIPLTVPLNAVPVKKQRPDLCIVTTVSVKSFRSERNQLCMIAERIGFDRKPTNDMVRADVDPAGAAWLLSWRDWLGEQFPGKQIDISTPVLYVNAALLLGSRVGVVLDRETLRASPKTERFENLAGVRFGPDIKTGPEIKLAPGIKFAPGIKVGPGIEIEPPIKVGPPIKLPPKPVIEFQALAFFGVLSIPLTMTETQ